MRAKRKVYICDQCGSVALEENRNLYLPGLLNGVLYHKHHDGWASFANMDLCPKCAEVYYRVINEFEYEILYGDKEKTECTAQNANLKTSE